ncbi:type I methionyl aminopeptidase [Candidatus Saccharibacteria bacterium]|nr:type I methionyl aminopeptidase [Candidatus Saccharibacteria bacterium]
MYTKIKTDDEIAAMRVGGRILATVLAIIEKAGEAGATTKELATIAINELERLGGKPAFRGYGQPPFPDVLCVSINDEVVHGIPRISTVLRKGDIVSIDFGVIYEGMVTDGARSFIVGDATKQAKQLVATTEKALYAGIDTLKAGVRVGDIASAIQKVLTGGGLGIVRDLVGHGVGHSLHEEPDIPNYGFGGSGPVLQAGMTIAIEPMATLGTHAVTLDDDQWTVRTADGSLAAHFEHTILITPRGYEILTQI